MSRSGCPHKPSDVARRRLVEETQIKARLEFAKRHLGDFMVEWKKVLWCDEIKMASWPSDKMLCLADIKHMATNTLSPTIKHGDARIMLWGWDNLGLG